MKEKIGKKLFEFCYHLRLVHYQGDEDAIFYYWHKKKIKPILIVEEDGNVRFRKIFEKLS